MELNENIPDNSAEAEDTESDAGRFDIIAYMEGGSNEWVYLSGHDAQTSANTASEPNQNSASRNQIFVLTKENSSCWVNFIGLRRSSSRPLNGLAPQRRRHRHPSPRATHRKGEEN